MDITTERHEAPAPRILGEGRQGGDDAAAPRPPGFFEVGKPTLNGAAPVVRLFWFRADGSAFDEHLRSEVLPALRESPGLSRLYLGRQGPEDGGRRALVTLWTSMRAVESARRGRTGDVLPGIVPAAHEIIPLSLLVFAAPDPGSGGILRVARGVVHDGHMGAYTAQVRDGLRAERARGDGPIWLAMGVAGSDRFVTLSTWEDWGSVERATGATLEEPIRTKRSSSLLSFEAEHLELV